jgi:hypothetical protein
MQTLYALDMTETPGTDSCWRKRQSPVVQRGSASERTPRDPELSQGGFRSPLGFWFAGADSWTTEVPRLRVEFRELDELGQANPSRESRSREGSSRCRTARAHLKAAVPAGRARARRASFPLTLEINQELATVEVDTGTWESVREAVLLVVAQFWRFGAIDRKLDEFAEWARDDLAATAGFRSAVLPRRARELRARHRLLQALILDLPDFEAALTDPRSYLAAGRPVRLYRALAARLGLDRWRREIDERIEVVEAIFDSLAESLNHLQSLSFQIALELIIVAVLLLDAGLFLVDALAKK